MKQTAKLLFWAAILPSVAFADTRLPVAEYCRALEADAFHAAPMTEAQLAEAGAQPMTITVAEIDAMSDQAYFDWWGSVLNRQAVTDDYNAKRPIEAVVLNPTRLSAYLERSWQEVSALCPSASEGAKMEYLVTTRDTLDVGVFPAGIEPVFSEAGAERLIGLPYDANGEVDITHPFWTNDRNLAGLGLPFRKDGRIDSTKLDANNLIHVAWSMAWDHQWKLQWKLERDARSERLRQARKAACILLGMSDEECGL